MKNYLRTLFFITVLTGGVACKKEGNPGQGAGNPDNNPANLVAETKPAVMKGITANVNSNIGGYVQALPYRYDSTTKRYPLLVFLHGIGELGNGVDNLMNVAGVGTPLLIKNKQFPANFSVNGKNFSFIVITPQFKAWPSAKDVNDMINYAINKYRIDTTRIYVSGLSMGGGVTWEYAAAYSNRVAAIVPICGASTPNDTKAKKLAQAGVAVWAFHNKDDSTVSYTNSEGYVNRMINFNVNPRPRFTLWPTGGHDAWTRATNPGYKENGMNMYEWMLTHQRVANK